MSLVSSPVLKESSCSYCFKLTLLAAIILNVAKNTAHYTMKGRLKWHTDYTSVQSSFRSMLQMDCRLPYLYSFVWDWSRKSKLPSHSCTIILAAESQKFCRQHITNPVDYTVYFFLYFYLIHDRLVPNPVQSQEIIIERCEPLNRPPCFFTPPDRFQNSCHHVFLRRYWSVVRRRRTYSQANNTTSAASSTGSTSSTGDRQDINVHELCPQHGDGTGLRSCQRTKQV